MASFDRVEHFFFKDLTATIITDDDMKRLEEDIPIVLCKLKCIFPPSFFLTLWNIFQSI